MITYLLPQPHNLEALEVAQLLPPQALLSALGEGAAIPLAHHVVIVPLPLQRSRADATREFGDDVVGEGHVREFGGVARDGVFCLVVRAFYEHLWDVCEHVSGFNGTYASHCFGDGVGVVGNVRVCGR